MSDFEQLNPCPFCGSGETLIVPGPSTWSGMKSSEPSTYSVRHWCDPIKGQPARMLERIGRDKQSAIEAWNTRAAIASMQGEAVEISKDSKLPFQIRIGNGTVGKGCKFSTLLLRINAHNEWFAQQGFHLIPDKDAKISEQDARIKELEQQLAKLEVNHSLLRKHVRMAIDIKPMSDECYDFLTAAIRQIGGAE